MLEGRTQLLTARRMAPALRLLQVATFAWTWVSTASPELLLPLLAELCQAWGTSLDKRLVRGSHTGC